MRKFHDWIDKAQPLRDPAYAGWHEFRAGAAGVLLWQEGQFDPALEVELASRLFRVPGYGQAGRAGFGFLDGNVSAIGLTSTFASGRPVDFLFDTETALLGHYSRDLWTDGEDLHGWDLFVWGTAGFEFGSHVWDIAGSGPKNQIAMVRFPGIDGRIRLFAGGFQVDCSLDLAFDFGGVEPSALLARLPSRPARSTRPSTTSRATTTPSAFTRRRPSRCATDPPDWARPSAPTCSGD